MAKQKEPKKQRFSWFDPHHGIERQTIMVGVSLLFLTGGFVVSQHHLSHERYVQTMTVDSAGTTATFSKSTSTVLTLGKTQLSPDQKTAYIPVTFSSMDNVGIKAANYRIYVAAADGKTMPYRMSGRFIMFGSKSRAVILLHSPKKIQNQPLGIAIMNSKKVSTVSQAAADDAVESNTSGSTDSSEFGKYDVAAFKVNPGATDVTNTKKNSRITVDSEDVQAVYETVFATKDIKSVRKQIAADNKKIGQYESAADGLIERLMNAGYVVPNAPKWLSDSWRPYDAVNLKTGKTANGKDVATYIADGGSSNDDPDAVEYASTLTNKDGTTTADADSASQADSSSSSDDSGSDTGQTTQTSASDQWSSLQQAWDTIKDLKRDIYVTQYASIYKFREQNKSIKTQSSIVGNTHFKQISKVESK